MGKMFSIFFCSLVGIMVLGTIVQANPIETTLVNYSIYQNNRPIDDSITFSVKCYGSYNEYRLKAMGLPENRSTTSPELVYSYSLSCDPNTCYREDTSHDPTWGMIISSCDLDGIYKRKKFFIRNFTVTPEPTCFQLPRWKFNGTIQYYALTFEDDRYCYNKYRSDLKDRCEKFLKPVKEGEKPWQLQILNGVRVNRTPEYDQCTMRVESEKPLCYKNYSRPVNNTALILKNPAVYCEKRSDIPLDNQTPMESPGLTRYSSTSSDAAVYTFGEPAIATARHINPVEALYCTILRFLGGRCE